MKTDDKPWMPPAFVPGLVSVIIPTFNRGQLLGEAIDSVLAQTYRPIECVVADANSMDNTLEIVRAKQAAIPAGDPFKLIYVNEPDRGASASRNLGLRNCAGEFIQFLDSDDVLMAEKLNRHVQALKANAVVDIIWSKWLIVGSDAVAAALQRANSELSRNLTGSPLTASFSEDIPSEPWPSLFRRRACVACGPWNEKLTRFEDWEYAVRMLAVSPKTLYLPGAYVVNREHQRRGVYDHPHRPDAVERGLKACHEARLVWAGKLGGNSKVGQLVAIRYWEMGLEALLLGAPQQAVEAFAGAKEMAQNAKFRFKARLAGWSLAVGGPRLAQIVLARYKYAFTQGGHYSAARYKTA